MKKKNERNAIPEETKNELKPEVEDGVKLTDEQMEQVSGGAGPEVKNAIAVDPHRRPPYDGDQQSGG